MASSLPPATIHHHHRHRHPSANISAIPLTCFLAGNYSATHTLSSSLQNRPYPLSNFNRCSGRRPATSLRPPPPPPPPTSDEDSSDLQGKLSRIQDRVQIFFAVLFWMSLFFWSSVWDRNKNDKGPPFRR